MSTTEAGAAAGEAGRNGAQPILESEGVTKAFGGLVAVEDVSFFIPDVFNNVPQKLGLDFDLTQLSFGIFGFLIVLMMVLRPEGLLPERRRKLELTEGIGAGEETVYEARA